MGRGAQGSKPKEIGTVGGYTLEVERIRKKMGGSLKPVKPSQKGLKNFQLKLEIKWAT